MVAVGRSVMIACVFAALLWASVQGKEYKTVPGGLPTWEVIGSRDGYLFLSIFEFADCSQDNYLLIIDGKGELVYYKQIPDCASVTDFRKQADGSLSYWEGIQPAPGIFDGSIYRMNDRYQVTQAITSAVFLDNHEFIVLPNGNYLYLLYVFGHRQGTIPGQTTVADVIIRETSQSGEIIFDWRSWDHIPLLDTDDRYITATPIIDYMHSNALEVDTDGNILLSSRHLNEITKIDRQTGEIIWRLGGKRNQFTLTNGTRWFSHQHDVRRLPNGNLSIFDNGNFLSPPYSRYVEYEIDEERKEITRTREISEGLFSFAMGSARNLEDGKVLIGWGAYSQPAVSEYNAENTETFRLSLESGKYSYRAYGEQWAGHPLTQPVLIHDNGTLYYSWNGDTEAAGYLVYGGSVVPDSLLVVQSKTGFEDNFPVRSGLCAYRVVFLDEQGDALAESNIVTVPGCSQVYLPIGG